MRIIATPSNPTPLRCTLLLAGVLVLLAGCGQQAQKTAPAPAPAAPAVSTAAAQELFPDEPASAASAEQLERGKAAYTRVCMSCHGAALEGTAFGTPLKGELFRSHWLGRTRAQFSAQVRATMPPRGIGALSGQAYEDVEAWVLAGNHGTAATSAAAVPQPAENSANGRGPPATNNDPVYLAALATRHAKLAQLTPVTDAVLRNPPPADWLIWRRGYDALGYSPLKRIDRSNVARLRTAWSWSLPQSGNEITPLVHDGVMFIYSGPVVQALDAASGDLLWQYLRVLPAHARDGTEARAKTLAIYGDLLYAGMADGHVVALDARSGRVAWDTEIIPDALRETHGKQDGVALHLAGGPIVARGRVILGVSLGTENSKGGDYIVGLNADTGVEEWRFHTIARPGEPGGDSWNDAPVEERFGGGAWTPGSYDPELDLVYFGIGNTYDSATLLEPRPGAQRVTRNDALYTDATVALRPDTGKLVWYYQHQRRDVWDLDWVFEQSIVTLPVNGSLRKLVVTAGKTAIFEAVDAATGQWVFAKDMGLQNLVAAIDPKTGEKTVNPAVQPEAGKTKMLFPSVVGGRNWPANAVNPETRMLYAPLLESCMGYIYKPRTAQETAKGGMDFDFAPCALPRHDGKFGRLAALDLASREIRWTHRQRVPLAGSVLATAGGVLFVGDLDRSFYAFDQGSGAILWRTRLNASPESFPVTYEANGRQYVAVVAGGGSPFAGFGRSLVQEVANPAAGITLHVFELPR